MKKVLVTGAGGFLGRNLIKKLLSEGLDVYAILSPDKACVPPEKQFLHILRLDLTDALRHTAEFPAGEIDAMYHFAWAGTKPENRNDFELQLKNVGMTMASMKLAAALGIKRVVFPGSANAYLYYGKPLDAHAVPTPADAYGAVKIALKTLCETYAETHGMDFIYTILTGVYGADRSDNNVISYAVDTLLRGEKPSFTKLEQQWDYIHIEDAVEALYRVGEKGNPETVYTIGSGDNRKLKDYIGIIHNAIDPSLPLGIGEVPYTENRMPRISVDLTAIRRDTGFSPRVDFETGITELIRIRRSEMGLDAQ